MTVKNCGARIHKNITRLRLEEDQQIRGGFPIMHRIIGFDAADGREYVLDWSTERDAARAEYAKMKRHLESGDQGLYNCCFSGLKKDYGNNGRRKQK